jgi:hypothetical protein
MDINRASANLFSEGLTDSTQSSLPKQSNTGITGSMNGLVGPISEKYCVYFYILSILALFFFAIVLVGIVYTGITKKMGITFYALALLYSGQFLLLYLQNRLHYNMCIHSI